MPEVIAAQSGPIGPERSSDPSSQSETFGAQDAPQEDAPQEPQEGANGAQQGPPAKEGRPKPESRYERTKRQRAALAQREAALKAREEQIAQAERAKSAPQKPDYTLEDLRKYRASWEAEGNFELVEKADAEIKRLEALEQAEHGQEA